MVLLLFFLPLGAWGRAPATLVKDYKGSHQDEFIVQYDRVRLLVKQAQLEVSARLGLFQYREGFQFPLTIRFEDGAPPGIENALAYVRLLETPAGFQQELVVNLDLMARMPMDIDQVFYHEMTHVVLNDAIGGEATRKIPPWVQEGLAQYVSGEGEKRVTDTAQHVRQSQVDILLYDLTGPVSGNAYPQYYLAIKFLYDKHTSNSVQALVHNLIAGKNPIESVEDSSGLTWARFQSDLREYSHNVLRDRALPDY